MSYIHIWQDLTKYVLERLTGQAVWYSTPERTENTTVTKEPEVRNLPRTFLFILQNKVNETICRKVKGGVLFELIHMKNITET